MTNKYDNTVIEVLDLEHGQLVKSFWMKNGLPYPDWQFHLCLKYNYDGRFYGFINGSFSNYTLEQVKKANAKIITLPTEENVYPKVMWVWDDDKINKAEKRLVKFNDGQYFWSYVTIEQGRFLISWGNASDTNPNEPKETILSISEIEEKLNIQKGTLKIKS